MNTLEEWLAFVATHLPAPVREERTDDATTFTGGDPGQVIVKVTRSRITVFEYAVGWTGPHTPVVSPRLIGTVVWLRSRTHEMTRAVAALIAAACASRLGRFRVCERCERSTPPEWMDDDRLCQSCVDAEPRQNLRSP